MTDKRDAGMKDYFGGNKDNFLILLHRQRWRVNHVWYVYRHPTLLSFFALLLYREAGCGNEIGTGISYCIPTHYWFTLYIKRGEFHFKDKTLVHIVRENNGFSATLPFPPPPSPTILKGNTAYNILALSRFDKD